MGVDVHVPDVVSEADAHQEIGQVVPRVGDPRPARPRLPFQRLPAADVLGVPGIKGQARVGPERDEQGRRRSERHDGRQQEPREAAGRRPFRQEAPRPGRGDRGHAHERAEGQAQESPRHGRDRADLLHGSRDGVDRRRPVVRHVRVEVPGRILLVERPAPAREHVDDEQGEPQTPDELAPVEGPRQRHRRQPERVVHEPVLRPVRDQEPEERDVEDRQGRRDPDPAVFPAPRHRPDGPGPRQRRQPDRREPGVEHVQEDVDGRPPVPKADVIPAHPHHVRSVPAGQPDPAGDDQVERVERVPGQENVPPPPEPGEHERDERDGQDDPAALPAYPPPRQTARARPEGDQRAARR